MIEKKPMGIFCSRSLRSRRLRSIRPPTTEILRLLKHLSWLYHNHAVTLQWRIMSSSSEREIWTLISPHSCNKRKKNSWQEFGRLLQMLFPRCHDRLSTAAVNRKERRQKCPKRWILIWPYFDRFAGIAGFQDPRASDRLHQANASVHMDSLLCMRSCKHSVISSWASCVSVPSTESQWETLDDDPPESTIDHTALLGGCVPRRLGVFFTGG